MDRLPTWVRQHVAALRGLLVLTVVFGILYPVVITLIAQVPGLKHRADGSLIRLDGKVVGSAVLGQSFTDAKGNPIPKYFQSRPSDAGAGYDPTASSASNLGPEEIIDELPDPSDPTDNPGRPGELTDVCSRSLAVGTLEGVNGRRPYCTADGIGAVLSVIRTNGLTGAVKSVVSVNQECPAKPFITTYDGMPVQCAKFGIDYRIGKIVLVHGPGKAWPDNPVPPDAVTASGSGLDPDISVAYADLQAPRVAKVRNLPLATVINLVHKYTSGRTLGFMGEPAVNVLQLNLALDRLQA
ncbi:MAG TPA: potassium-transporting ATPase subunit C [Mycobacteriales bacterium]|nr:potassium-transporting ATPase subunit C [Mycobacteriales bacterium]